MNISNKQEPFILFLGDILCFFAALWLSLFIRYLEAPNYDFFILHVLPFSFLLVLWFGVFFLFGLYEKHTLIFKTKLPTLLLNAQAVNIILAIAFFYFASFVRINPKTTLFLYVIVSSILIFAWRLYGFELFVTRRRQKALLIGSGEEIAELYEEVNNNSRYKLFFSEIIDTRKIERSEFQNYVLEKIKNEKISVIVADFDDRYLEGLLPKLYNLLFGDVYFINMHRVYEDIFDRVPLSLLNYNWFIQNLSQPASPIYDFLRRLLDIILSIPVGILSIILYPFVAVAILLEDGGPVLITQERVGYKNKRIFVYKFRSMKNTDSGAWIGETKNKVTRVGNFLRKTSIDELPQIWNVLRGDLSLIGPRSDIVSLEKRLREEIYYYNIRYIIKPGISGWAQINQSYAPGNISPQSIAESKIRLAYDIYYVKNRSFFLDIKIAIRTIQVLISRIFD